MKTIEQIRARLAEISEELGGIQASENGYSQEQLDQINALNGEFEQLGEQLEAAEKVESMKAKATTTTGRKTQAGSPNPAPAGDVSVAASRQERLGGFKSAGDFLMAVKKAAQTGDLAPQFKNTAFEKVGEDGGFLVPEEISQSILKKMEGDDSLMARATTLQVGGNTLAINVDENAPWSGGVQAFWVGEGKAIDESKPSFKQAQFRLHKLAALVTATDELLEDGTALESYIKTAAPAAILHQVNKAILVGNGVGKPSGIIQSPFTVTVAAESMQTADTVNAINVIKMYSRMLPQSRANAVWLIHPMLEEQLRLLKDDNGNYIYLAPGSQMNQTPYASLLGRPVMPLMGGIPQPGDLGDIMFVDLAYYYMIRKAQGVKSATSIHLHFDKELTAFRFSLRLDGKCPYSAPVTTEFGAYKMSAFVQLAAR